MKLQGKYLAELLNFTIQGANKWKREKRPIITLLEKYYSDEDLEEFLRTGKILRLETAEQSEIKISKYEESVLDHALYSVKDKIKRYTAPLLQGGGYKLKDILLIALDNIYKGLETPDIDLAKQTLIATINTVEITVLKIPVPKKVASVSSWVEYNLSNIEAYVLIKHYKQIFEMIEAESNLK